MNNKLMASVVVVALCAVAFVGVGYAYTATVEDTGNKVTSEYASISIVNEEGNELGADAVYNFDLQWNSETEYEGTTPTVTYTLDKTTNSITGYVKITPSANASGTLKITLSGGQDLSGFKLSGDLEVKTESSPTLTLGDAVDFASATVDQTTVYSASLSEAVNTTTSGTVVMFKLALTSDPITSGVPVVSITDVKLTAVYTVNSSSNEGL